MSDPAILAILRVIERYRSTQKSTKFKGLLNQLEKDVRQVIEEYHPAEKKLPQNGKCQLCDRESNKLKDGKFCPTCYTQFIE